MSELLGEHAENIKEITAVQMETLKNLAEEVSLVDIVLPKSERTSAKIMKMGDMYVGDDWDDVAEVLEWMSFFVGGAIVHWQLIAGAAEEMKHDDFKKITESGTEYYIRLMSQLQAYATEVGKKELIAKFFIEDSCQNCRV